MKEDEAEVVLIVRSIVRFFFFCFMLKMLLVP